MTYIRNKISLQIGSSFWIFSVLIALTLSPGNFLDALFWFLIICFSVIIHELGHALTAVFFGKSSQIDLVALGGITYFDATHLAFWKQFFIALNGPLFGFLLATAAYYAALHLANERTITQQWLNNLTFINIGWALVNLIPILPLDGGQILRLGLEKIWGFTSRKYMYLFSALFALLLSLFLFGVKLFFGGILFFLFFFDNYNQFRQTRFIQKTDHNLETTHELKEAEKLFKLGKKQEALQAFEKLHATTQSGLISDISAQYLSTLYYEKGELKKAYALLIKLKNRLEGQELIFLHQMAFEMKDYPTVVELSGRVFQLAPRPQIALKNGYAAALINDPIATVGWLQTAKSQGVENISTLIQGEAFDRVRNHPHFKKFSIKAF